MRSLYQFFLFLIFPFIWVRLMWRARKALDYAKYWRERLGLVSFKLPPSRPGSIWIHSASLGETIAATPLIQFLQKKYSAYPLVLTAMTPTGRARATLLRKDNANTFVSYVPYDYPFAIKKFLKTIKPKIAIFMETELWPNILFLCGEYRIPFMLANARLSEKSKQGYFRVASLARAMLQSVYVVAAQTKEDKDRFIQLGVAKDKIHITGSLKFDLNVSPELLEKARILREHIGISRSVLIAGSTHTGEDQIILKSFVELRREFPDLLLILAPRHPERFSEVTELCLQTHLLVQRRSQTLPTRETVIYVGDTLGELLLLYAASDVAFVGGSFIPQGGHNPLEPAAVGLPVVMGPHVFNFLEITNLLKAEGALTLVDAAALTETVGMYFRDPTKRMRDGHAAKQVVENNRGALQRQLTLITGMLGEDR